MRLELLELTCFGDLRYLRGLRTGLRHLFGLLVTLVGLVELADRFRQVTSALVHLVLFYSLCKGLRGFVLIESQSTPGCDGLLRVVNNGVLLLVALSRNSTRLASPWRSRLLTEMIVRLEQV